MKPAVSFSPTTGASEVLGRRPLIERFPESMWLSAALQQSLKLVESWSGPCEMTSDLSQHCGLPGSAGVTSERSLGWRGREQIPVRPLLLPCKLEK